jgi:hypothetical protein
MNHDPDYNNAAGLYKRLLPLVILNDWQAYQYPLTAETMQQLAYNEQNIMYFDGLTIPQNGTNRNLTPQQHVEQTLEQINLLLKKLGIAQFADQLEPLKAYVTHGQNPANKLRQQFSRFLEKEGNHTTEDAHRLSLGYDHPDGLTVLVKDFSIQHLAHLQEREEQLGTQGLLHHMYNTPKQIHDLIMPDHD